MIKNYFVLNRILNFKALIFFFIFFVFSQISNGQCTATIAGCSFTDLSNYGSNSNNDASTIEYDNFVSAFHTTLVRTPDGSFQVWGEDIGSDGTSDVLSPMNINSVNFPALTTALPLKAALASSGTINVQGILLATDGLYAWSREGLVLDASITTSKAFQKLTINGNTNGLPPNLSPGDIKMMFAAYGTLAITTCSGEVWVISQTPSVRGNGAAGNSTTWYRVTTADFGNPPLKHIVACRGNYDGLMALKSDGTVYVWGRNVYLGNNTPPLPNQDRAVQMTLPVSTTPKMIGSTGSYGERSYYILATDGNLYSLGANYYRELGDLTAVNRLSWVQPRYPSAGNPLMNNIKWFSPQEHDRILGSINVLNSDRTIYAFGFNDSFMTGTGISSVPSNPSIPNGLSSRNDILAVETGGHTSMIVKNCETNFGYVGHRVNGSMGDGSNTSKIEHSYNFNTADVQICGAESNPVIHSAAGNGPGSDYCLNDPVLLNPTPAGGTLIVLSGPGSLTGNILNFTGTGTVKVQYSVASACSISPIVISRDFNSVECPSDLQITKEVNNLNPSIGDNVVFTITAANNGPYNATGITINEVLPAGYTFISAVPSSGRWSAPKWTIGSLIPGASAALSITAAVNSSGSYANTAVITGNDPDTNPANNTATVTPVVQADLAVTKTAGSTAPNVGNNIIFTITASNTGPSDATEVTVHDLLPSGYTFVSAVSSAGVWSAPDWTINRLANGASETLTITAAVNPAGPYTNTADISAMENDPQPANNTASSTPAVNHFPIANNDDLTAFPLQNDSQGTVNILTNDTDQEGNPNAPLNGIGQFTVDLNPALAGVQTIYTDTKGSWSLNTATGIVTFDPDHNFNGTALLTYILCDPAGLCDNTDITFVVKPILEAVNDPLSLADGINGSLQVVNVLNNDTLNGAAVLSSELIINAVNFPFGITLNSDGTIDTAPNTASGRHILTYQICEKANPTNCSTATVQIFIEAPAVAIVKKGVFNDTNTNGFTEAGETITYSFTITNRGNTDLQNITVSDPLPGIMISGGPVSLAVGQSDNSSFTAVYSLTQADINSGSVTNQAAVSAVTNSGIAVQDKSDFADPAADNPTIIELSDCALKIFNAVSANGDQDNNRFYIQGMECHPENTVQIYNRWGVLVFEKDHYNNNDIAFKGISEGRVTIKDSNGLPEGTYYYIIKYKDKQSKLQQKTGYLYLTK